MNKKIFLLSTLLGALIFSPTVFAATTASQTVTGTLGAMKQVVTNGGNVAATIDTDTGNLGTAFTPAFRITTNTNASQALRMTSSINYDGGTEYAIFDKSGVRYIILTNNTVLPNNLTILDIRAGSPTPANNPNAIAYPVTEPSDIGGQLTYTWDYTNKYWDANLTHKGNTDTSLTIPAGAPMSGTYSADDEPGPYQATITLSFV